MNHQADSEWDTYIQRYVKGERRAPIFRDMIIADSQKLCQNKEHDGLSLLDIGCGGGFDSDPKLQYSLAQIADNYIGVEPDEEIKLSDFFTSVHRHRFEDAPIEPNSINIAFAVMVLEHFEDPELFWEKIHKVLRPGGVFWGFTVDSRHWFRFASLLTERLHIKDLYLNMLHGKRGEQRYENYGVFYRSNTPQQIDRMTKSFSNRTFLNFHRVGQLDYYIPKKLQWLSKTFDRYAIRMGWPGCIMAVRVVK